MENQKTEEEVRNSLLNTLVDLNSTYSQAKWGQVFHGRQLSEVISLVHVTTKDERVGGGGGGVNSVCRTGGRGGGGVISVDF